MEFILINKDKLKIIFTEKDMKDLKMEPDGFDYSDNLSKKVIRDILERAQNETGFTTNNSKLYIKMFTSQKGGCELFVSRMAGDHKYNIDSDNDIYEPASFNVYYITLDFDTLCRVTDRIHRSGKKYSTSLYTDNDSHYHLIFIEKIIGSASFDKNNINDAYPPFLNEYGKIYNSDKKIIDYLNEYSNPLITENAIETLYTVFD